jgi:predicted nucleotidyltransferase
VTLLGMVGGLTEARVRFVVVGGLAATAHGSARITDDVDVCYDTAPDNVAALARVLSGWNAYPRGIEAGLPFVMDERTMHAAPVLTLTTTQGNVDLMDIIAGIGDYRRCLAESEEIEVPPLRFRALTLPALIRAKRAAGRTKDFEHLVELEAIAETVRRRKVR